MRALFPLLLCVACEPPPAIELGGVENEELSITVVYPPSSNDEGTGPFAIQRSSDGTYIVPIVVDVTGIDLVDPFTDPPLDSTQGHWHADAPGASTLATSERFGDLVVDGAGITADFTTVITVSMRENDHAARAVGEAVVQDTVEVVLVAP